MSEKYDISLDKAQVAYLFRLAREDAAQFGYPQSLGLRRHLDVLNQLLAANDYFIDKTPTQEEDDA